MARSELGTKRVCPTTGRKFYDLNRDPIVSPYTGEVLARSLFEPAAAKGPAARGRPEPAEEDEVEATPAGPELVSLEEVGAAEEEAVVADEDATLPEDTSADDDTFLEEEEEGGDVADLIDGDIEEDEES